MRRLFCIIILLLMQTGWCWPQSFSDPALDSVASILPGEKDPWRRLKLLDTIVVHSMNVDTTFKYATIYLDLATEMESTQAITNALYGLGWCNFHQGRFGDAIALYERAIDIDATDTSTLAPCYIELASCHYSLGNFDAADTYCRKALDLYQQHGDMELVSESYRFLANMCIEYHFYDLGLSYVEMALEIDRSLDPPHGEIMDLMLLGYLDYMKYLYSGRSDSLLSSSLMLLKRSKAMVDSVNDELARCDLMEKMAMVYLAQSEAEPPKNRDRRHALSDSAIACTQIGGALTRKYGFDEGWLVLYMLEAQAYINKDETDSVEEHLSFINSRYDYRADHRRNIGGRFYQLSANYNKMLGNYEEAYRYITMLRHYNFDRYCFDLGSKINKIQAKENYERTVKELNVSAIKRNIEFVNHRKMHGIIHNWLLGATILAFLILLVGIVNYLVLRNQNSRMKRQTDAITSQNLELSGQHQKFQMLQNKYETERQDLNTKKMLFRKANRSIITSLRHARQMQDVLMPSRTMMNQIFGDCLIYWKPLQMVSGDYYWAIQVRDVKVLVGADCTGHGVPGAFMSMLGISSLRNILSPRNVFSPEFSAAFVIDEMRQKVIKSLRQMGDDMEQYDSMDMSVVVTRVGDSRIEYAGANRPLMIAGVDGVREYQPDYMPAGFDINATQVPFTNHVIECASGEVIYMYSDGITDQFGGRGGRTKFGDRRLRDMLAAMYKLPFAQQYQKLRECEFAWTCTKCDGEALMELYSPQLDDQMILGIRI
ncbi:MAG: tetratricopeptide repeat protein [Bacteroidales bacterium]|nr:tetratricopeptide repeat protein [Bacteroidales bacterium]